MMALEASALQHAVTRDGRPVGLLDLPADQAGEVASKPRDAGYEVSEVEVDLAAECEADQNERPCELAAALYTAQAMIDEAQLPPGRVQEVIGRGAATETEVREALEADLGRLPGDMAPQRTALMQEAFGHGA